MRIDRETCRSDDVRPQQQSPRRRYGLLPCKTTRRRKPPRSVFPRLLASQIPQYLDGASVGQQTVPTLDNYESDLAGVGIAFVKANDSRFACSTRSVTAEIAISDNTIASALIGHVVIHDDSLAEQSVECFIRWTP